MILLISYRFFGTDVYLNIGASKNGLVTAFCKGMDSFNHFSASTQYLSFKEMKENGFDLTFLEKDPRFVRMMDLDRANREKALEAIKVAA